MKKLKTLNDIDINNKKVIIRVDFNVPIKEGIMSELVVDVIDKGYKYYDWNVDSGDAGGAKSKEDIYNNIKLYS